MGRGPSQGEHARVGDELYWDWNVVFPRSQTFIVRCRDESTILVNKCEGVDGSKVVVVFLCHFSASCVELNNLFVGHAGQEFVAAISRVEADAMRRFACREARYAFPIFSIPQLHLSIERSR